MNKNQKGFSAVEILIVVVVVGLIGGASWYVWQSKNKDTKATNTQTTQQTTSQQATEKETANNESSTTKQGYKLYDDKNLSLQHPDNWTSYREDDQPDWVFFKSPDYVPATELGPSVKAGQWLEIRVAKSESYESYEEDLKNAPIGQENHGGTYESIKIDGHNTILSDTKTHGTFWRATTYYNGKTYFFRLNVIDEDKPEVKELFKTILSTVKIK